MKKFWEKHDLFKIAGLMVLLTVVLTWIIPQGYFQGELSIGEITRVGIFDFFTYGLLGMYYFTVLVTFLFVLGGFYQVLSKASGYQKLTDGIAKSFKGKEIVFALVVSFIIAALTAVMNEYFVVMVFAPFFITILAKMKLDKITGFVTTYGSILVGILGSVYCTKIIGQSITNMGFAYDTYIWVRVGIFAFAFILFSVFNVLHMKKTLKDKKADELIDMYEGPEATKKAKVWPVALILGLFAIVAILAYLPWEEAFNVTFFATITDKIAQAEILDSTVFAYILGNVTKFGAWDVFGVQIIMLIAALIVKWCYRIKTDDFYTAFGEGFAKAGKAVILLLMTYLILEFAVMYPVVPVIADWLMNLTSKFNVILVTIVGLFTSLFSVEYQYATTLVGSYLTTGYATFASQITVMLQAAYGIISFIAPSSAILLIGLSACGISYKEWFKYIWKFIVITILALIILMLVIC